MHERQEPSTNRFLERVVGTSGGEILQGQETFGGRDLQRHVDVMGTCWFSAGNALVTRGPAWDRSYWVTASLRLTRERQT